jgi:succinate-semialdehyde dehydrogenase/glutarate-semialdehyde dehydrogenase
MHRWAQFISRDCESLAELLVLEQGKPISEARNEITYAASFLTWYAEEGRRAYGEIIPGDKQGVRTLVLREPIGVGAAITPWNFPAAMITRKVAPALAAGCTIVIKPSEQTPLSAIALCALAHEAGLPAGVINLVLGDRDDAAAIGLELTSNEIVRKISFTGSTHVGRQLMAQSAATVKSVALELGGNAPFIVFDDADLDAALDGLMICKYRNAGQTCVSANRILVASSIHDEFVEKLTQRVSALKMGNGMDPSTQIGPLIDRKAVLKTEAHVTDAVKKGAIISTGGARGSLGGNFYAPTVITNVAESSLAFQEETFGPVAFIRSFSEEAEAIAIANNTPYGLASYFYSTSSDRVWRVGERLESGMVGVNEVDLSTPTAPFGGVKQSGLGREGSRHGLDDWLETKYIRQRVAVSSG